MDAHERNAGAQVTVQGKPGGTFSTDFCSSRHPRRDDVWCRRMKNHDGMCKAYGFGIKEPDEWWKEVQL